MGKRRFAFLAASAAASAMSAALPTPATAQSPCVPGYVWREAFVGDFACVPEPSRARARLDNADAANRRVPPRPGDPTCQSGFVWREAFPGDQVCVPPPERDTAAQENALAPQRTSLTSQSLGGPRTCNSGFVWREAGPTDFVCVPPPSRGTARAQNAAAESRRGSSECRQGFVWREAGPTDFVCVPEPTRRETRMENALAAQRSMAVAGPRCDAYADTAVAQFQEMIAGRCNLTGQRWQSNRAAHYGWCLGAAEQDRGGEEGARREQLRRCRASQPPPVPLVSSSLGAVPSSTLFRWRVEGANFTPNEAVNFAIASVVESRVTALDPFSTQANSVGQVLFERLMPCPTGQITVYRATVTRVSSGQTFVASSSC